MTEPIEKIQIHIPITRSFEDKGEKFVYGYACIFDSPDAFGTVISKRVITKSLPRLRNFPALRYMHRTPLGRIIFDKKVNGLETFVDEHGFHILAKVYDACQQEWEMIKEGNFGFSYGMLPNQNGIQRQKINGKEVDVFVDGELYEISVVDTPAHPEASAHVINRTLTFIPSTQKNSGTPRKEGFLGMLEDAFPPDTTPPEPQPIMRGFGRGFRGMLDDLKRRSLEMDYPEYCSKQCPYVQCSSWGVTEMQGKPCRNRTPINPPSQW